MIGIAPYDDHGAMTVFERLDPADLAEATAIRGAATTHLELFADWRAMRPGWVASYVLRTRPEGGQPFAVLALGNTGQHGVAQAAMLARDHRRYRRELFWVARLIRHHIAPMCHDLGIRRIEARCWTAHPRAAAFLTAAGFTCEIAHMPGFGPAGDQAFAQFAYQPPAQQEDTPCAQ